MSTPHSQIIPPGANDQYFMELALGQAKKALLADEVPVGAILTIKDKLVATGYNTPIATNDPTAHAEIIALRKASLLQDNYRLPAETCLYVTLEPCLMCMGAIIHARLGRLVFGAFDPKTGAAESCYRIGRDQLLNHNLQVVGGILAEDCAKILKDFFKNKRKRVP